MRTKIYFVRHAEAQTNVDPFFKGEVNGLTETGLEQAKLVAGYFKNIQIAEIFTSDSVRAKLTAFEIEKVIDKKLSTKEFFNERSVVYINSTTFENKETFESFIKRLVEVKEFLENLPVGNFVFVGHAIFLKALVSYLLVGDSNADELLEKISDSIIIDNASVSKFMYNKEKLSWKVEFLNNKTHLE